MTRRAVWIVVAAGWTSAGCFSSLLDAPCAAGYDRVDDACVPADQPDGAPGPDAAPDARPGDPPDADHPDAGPDAVPVADATAAPDAFACPAPLTECSEGTCVDTSSDPFNCGSCGHECASGICVDSVCAGAIVGHVVAIGHDYVAHNGAMERLLANAIALGDGQTVTIAWWRGTASLAAHSGATIAANQGLAVIGRPHVTTPIVDLDQAAGHDVLVIDAQLGAGAAAEATGTAHHAALDAFIAAGGVVIVLEGASGVSFRLARGAGLFDVPGITDVSGQVAVVVDPADAITPQVVSPYLAGTSSVTFQGAPAHTIDVGAAALAFHVTR